MTGMKMKGGNVIPIEHGTLFWEIIAVIGTILGIVAIWWGVIR